MARMTNFRAIDMPGSRKKPATVPAPSRPAPVPSGPATPKPSRPMAAPTTPVGTISEVMNWVGSDKSRAARALRTERLSESPRSTLVARLTETLGTS